MSKHYGKKPAPQQPKSSPPWAPLAVVGAVALILIGIAVLAAPRQATTGGASGDPTTANGPRVAVDREKLDFGKVAMDTPVTAAFKVKNIGSEPLLILSQPQVRVVEGC